MSFRSRPLMLAILMVLTAGTASAQNLFTGSGGAPLGLTPVTPPRVTPPPNAGTSPYTGNQCKLIAGTCPTGRLVRSGTLCFCATKDGGATQGTSRKRPQGSGG
ncbi:hypothetical protein OSH11_10105 [Kaistia dalseonensis]|uniref:Uncharacterized protein n=1 Tax=Kaistia dalseonensis TaxID=410840 RepID=A0ABU0H811_9HYPH|nr:hypothetical protein [Kaistia dalseonensis]MCX5495057.1 hypothetical protein [Kaistia dalseonensis]MDQ0437639.1 hypothetical protein [Kaistia dalseonensis]